MAWRAGGDGHGHSPSKTLCPQTGEVCDCEYRDRCDPLAEDDHIIESTLVESDADVGGTCPSTGGCGSCPSQAHCAGLRLKLGLAST